MIEVRLFGASRTGETPELTEEVARTVEPPAERSLTEGVAAHQVGSGRTPLLPLAGNSPPTRTRAQPVARALGKRWECRLPAGSWAQPRTNASRLQGGLRPPGRLEAGAPNTIEVVLIRRNMAQRHRYFVVTAMIPA